MASSKPSVKLQRAKIRNVNNVSPTGLPTSEDSSVSPPDFSVLRKSIKTSVTGFSQARNVYDTGTVELKQLLSLECDIVYECRVCRNLFRSLANFISHKRVYCTEKFNSNQHPHFNNNNHTREDIGTILQYEEDFQEFIRNKDKTSNNENYDSEHIQNKNLVTKDLTSVIERLLHKNQQENQPENNIVVPIRHIKLQSIPDSKNAIYQNVYSNRFIPDDLVRDEVAELDRLISSNEAILGPDGKLLSRDHLVLPALNELGCANKDLFSNQSDLFCNICKINFATQKTLKFHMKIKHAENRLVYPCPDCTDTFSNSWSVFRHLFKVHRKSATHIRKLRETIQNKAFKSSVSTNSENRSKSCEAIRDSITEQQRKDQENQAWIDNLEADGDIPRCGGCGKRFERRAALSAHRQTCQLRKSAQNKININLQKRTLPKSAQKDSEDSCVSIKTAKVEKAERKIEIKIRRDYNKSSPLSVRTNSPALADEDTTMEPLENIDSINISRIIGENDYNFSSINFSNTDMQDDVNFMETVKDCDDAMVDDNSKNTDNSIDDSNYTYDNELDFENITNSFNKGGSGKACGQQLISSNAFIKVEPNSDGNDIFPVSIENIKIEMPDNDENDLKPGVLKPGEYQCEYCLNKFKQKNKLERHITRHLVWKKFECKLCGLKNCNIHKYKNHMKQHHRNVIIGQMNSDLRENSISNTVVCKQEMDDSSEFLSNEVLYDNSGLNESPNNKIDVEEESTSDSKLKSSLKQLKRAKRLMEKSKKIDEEHPIGLYDSSNSSGQPQFAQFAQFSKLEPMFDDVIGKIKNTLPIKLKHKGSLKTGIKLKLQSSNSDDVKPKHKSPKKKELKIKKLKKNSGKKKYTQRIASSESYTVQRPVRNRVKPFDKDFEYDCSYLPRLKAENRETSILSQKPQMKRKQFLQSETLAAELSKPWEEIDRISEKEPPLIPKLLNPIKIPMSTKPQTPAISLSPKPYQGALQSMSMKVASLGRALVKTKIVAITRRNTPPFIRTAYRPPVETIVPPKPEKSTNLAPSNHGATEKTVLPWKTIPKKVAQSPSTVSKTSEKLYLGKIHRRIGTPKMKLPQKLTVLTQKTPKTLIEPVKKKKLKIKHSRKLPTAKSPVELDHQALKSKIPSGEITLISKLQSTEKELESSSKSSLSILPSNGNSNNSSFVNISLKQLKNLQKGQSPYHIPKKNIVTKNIYALKNLEENNEIKISKVISNKADIFNNKDLVFKSMADAFNKPRMKKKSKGYEQVKASRNQITKNTSSISLESSNLDDTATLYGVNEDVDTLDFLSVTLTEKIGSASILDAKTKKYFNNKTSSRSLLKSSHTSHETAKYMYKRDDASYLE